MRTVVILLSVALVMLGCSPELPGVDAVQTHVILEEHPIRSLEMSPDGNFLTYLLVDAASDSTRVVYDLKSNERIVILDDVSYVHAKWSADSSRVAFWGPLSYDSSYFPSVYIYYLKDKSVEQHFPKGKRGNWPTVLELLETEIHLLTLGGRVESFDLVTGQQTVISRSFGVRPKRLETGEYAATYMEYTNEKHRLILRTGPPDTSFDDPEFNRVFDEVNEPYAVIAWVGDILLLSHENSACYFFDLNSRQLTPTGISEIFIGFQIEGFRFYGRNQGNLLVVDYQDGTVKSTGIKIPPQASIIAESRGAVAIADNKTLEITVYAVDID